MQMERVAVVGAGAMGSEIAQVVAASGRRVVLVDVAADALERGLAHIEAICDRRVARGRMTPDGASALLARVSGSTHLAAAGDADLVIEAAPEVLDLKREIFRSLDATAPAGAVLASNTSGLSITALAGETARPGRVLGLHFFNPASVMRLVEVIQGETTDEATVELGIGFATEIGKTPVRVRECPGFLVNRILVRALAEAYRHAEDVGADRRSADAAVVALGPAPMGPFALGDLIGLDVAAHVRRDLEAAYGERFGDGGVLDREVAAGRLGDKSGAGLLTESDEATPDGRGPEVAERYYLGALEEACRCLEEEVARLEDVDVAMRLGAGWSEGPLQWADEAGLPVLVERMDALAAAGVERLGAPAILRDRAAHGETFAGGTEERA
jgi:3-hydroxyacyl-CoA dehydrogenase